MLSKLIKEVKPALMCPRLWTEGRAVAWSGHRSLCVMTNEFVRGTLSAFFLFQMFYRDDASFKHEFTRVTLLQGHKMGGGGFKCTLKRSDSS